MVVQQQVMAWKWLKDQMKHIQDPTLKNAMWAEFKKRAFEEWGYNPDSGFVKLKKGTVEDELTDWEKELVEDINDSIKYGFDTFAEKREKTSQEAKARMNYFIEKGGSLSDLPFRNKTIDKLYFDCIFAEIDRLMEML